MSTEEPMSIEDRVRTATRAGATLVRDIRPLAAPAPTRRPSPAARRWLSGGIPLAAAAAVVLLALSLVAVRGGHSGSSDVGSVPARTTVPRYFAALYDPRHTDGAEVTGTVPLIVGDDVTGAVIDTISPPHGLHFVSIEGTFDDRTFVVLAAGQGEPARDDTLLLLRIAPGSGNPYRLTKLPVELPGIDPVVFFYALSPDGRELAVESAPGKVTSGAILTLGIYSASSGAELRAWSTGAASGPLFSLSWLSDGRQLAIGMYNLSGPHHGYQLRTLDVTGAGPDLLAASHAVFPVQKPIPSPSGCRAMSLTPDGGTVVCGSHYDSLTPPGASAGCANGGLGFTAYSVRTGQPIRVLYRYPGTCSNGQAFVAWTDASATSIIGITETDIANTGGRQADQLGVITNGHIRLLKLPASVPPFDYPTLAF